MKFVNKTVFSLILVFGALCLVTPLSFGAVYTFDMPISEMDHGSAYYWGLSQSLGQNEKITKASLGFRNINDWIIEPEDIIYVHLFENAPYGIKNKKFNDNKTGDFFKGHGTYLFNYSDNNEKKEKKWNRRKKKWEWVWVNDSENYGYNFTQGQINKLSKAMEDGKFAFGLDPDCHYCLNGITFNIETVSTPEPASLSLLGLGLVGLLRLRRKAKN